MKINADLSQRAAVDSEALAWVPSPMPGVERRMLERDGEEVARVTSIVRYAPKSYFSEHSHSGGEEYLVLEGTFSDNYGDFPVGTYVRNPVASRHTPHSEGGAIIWVKLWWMHPEDQAFVRLNTQDESRWEATDVPGIETMPLHRFRNEETVLLRLAPGAGMAARDLPGGEEIFVIAGTVEDENGGYGKGGWLRNPIGQAPEMHSPDGATLLVKRGQLADLPPAPPAA